jgi:hypothetical protein
MNRRDFTSGGQQAGGFQDGKSGPQPGQWQDGTAQQAGGHWEENEDMHQAAAEMNAEGAAGDQPAAEAPTPATPNEPLYPLHNFDAANGSTFSAFTSEDYGGRDFSAGPAGLGGAISGGMHPSDTYRPSYGLGRWMHHDHDYGNWRAYGEHRGFLRRAGDEIASWFGSDEAAHRRELDHRGRGPSDYTRSDERIHEDVNDALTADWRLDASHVRVTVSEGEVTLDGMVYSRPDKRLAEDLAETVAGVRHVQNNLRVDPAAAGRTAGSDMH